MQHAAASPIDSCLSIWLWRLIARSVGSYDRKTPHQRGADRLCWCSRGDYPSSVERDCLSWKRSGHPHRVMQRDHFREGELPASLAPRPKRHEPPRRVRVCTQIRKAAVAHSNKGHARHPDGRTGPLPARNCGIARLMHRGCSTRVHGGVTPTQPPYPPSGARTHLATNQLHAAGGVRWTNRELKKI